MDSQGPSTENQIDVKEIKKEEKAVKEEVKYFECSLCGLKERYEYFGNTAPFTKHYKFLENCYMIEDPFIPPKQGEFIILGAHCIKCGAGVCKDPNCSLYFDGSYCIHCAKKYIKTFPPNVQEKLNKIIVT